MSIDYKTAKHICGVVRRQVQNGIPGLYLNFIIHGENEREKEFHNAGSTILEHPAGKSLIQHMKSEQGKEVLLQKRSRFYVLSYARSPGFLGFYQNETYLALCFVNCDRFGNKDHLQNHIMHMAWHAIALHRDYTTFKSNPDKSVKPAFIDQNNILKSSLEPSRQYHRNLRADIFSASLQAIKGNKNAVTKLSRQRMKDTLTPETGFIAENFPFPICLDTLEYILESNIDQYKKSRKPTLVAKKIAEDIGETYKNQSIEQWRTFARPAQEMAWNGFKPETILGAALYTGENTYAQSISDMISERLNIKPEFITTLHDYNPFTYQESNERSHKKYSYELIHNLLGKIRTRGDYFLFIDIAKKQSLMLLENSSMGWCSSALILAMDIVKHSDETDDFAAILEQAREAFRDEVDSIPWDTLAHFSHILFERRRKGLGNTIHDVIEVAAQSDEFSTIHRTLQTLENIDEVEIEYSQQATSIMDFINPNSVKKAKEKPPSEET